MNIFSVPPAPTPVRGGGLTFSQVRRSVGLAVRSLWLHKLRSMLSVLGIIIGTGAVISLMAFGEGSMQDALEDIKRQGATNIIVRSDKPPDDSATASRSFVANYGLKFRDLDRFSTFGDAIVRMVPMRVFPSEVRYLERQTSNSRMVATVPDYAEVNKIALARGRFLTEEDERNEMNVCVVGSAIADRLFPFEDPIGKTVQCRNHRYLVVGVAADRMPSAGGGGSQAAEDFNQYLYVPFSTCRGRVGNTVFIRSSGSRSGEQVEVSQVTITLSDTDKVRPVGAEIKRILEQDHDKKDWLVTIPLDRLEEAERAQDRFTTLMAMIAGISLLVGGIGIMNIMLATVTERTREIGIRRALGAKQRDVTVQFLVEATVQTAVGGLLGVAVGLTLVFLVPVAPGGLGWAAEHLRMPEFAAALRGLNVPAKVHRGSIVLALVVSVGVGILFGWYPARRAAKLDPIEALRHD